jgi:hypothetical protein
VPLATTLVQPPDAVPTGVLWLAVGALAWAAASLPRPARAVPARPGPA